VQPVNAVMLVGLSKGNAANEMPLRVEHCLIYVSVLPFPAPYSLLEWHSWIFLLRELPVFQGRPLVSSISNLSDKLVIFSVQISEKYSLAFKIHVMMATQ
jgi:hypothetical protein